MIKQTHNSQSDKSITKEEPTNNIITEEIGKKFKVNSILTFSPGHLLRTSKGQNNLRIKQQARNYLGTNQRGLKVSNEVRI